MRENWKYPGIQLLFNPLFSPTLFFSFNYIIPFSCFPSLCLFLLFLQTGNLWDGRGRNCGIGKADARYPLCNKVSDNHIQQASRPCKN